MKRGGKKGWRESVEQFVGRQNNSLGKERKM